MPRFYSRAQQRQRRAVRCVLAAGDLWDGTSVQISVDGVVTAVRDPQKTMRSEDPSRQVVGTVRDIIGEEYAPNRRN